MDGLGTDETIYGNFADSVHGYSNQSVLFPKQDDLVSLDIQSQLILKEPIHLQSTLTLPIMLH